MLKLNIPNLEAIRNWCNEKFQPKGNYITKSEISNEVNETDITLSDLSETVPEAISAMSEEKKLKNLLSHIKAFMTGSKALIDLCVTTGMITQQNINDENKIPSAALLYSLNDALNGQVAQINSKILTYTGEIEFRAYAGSNIVRYFTIPYSIPNGYKLLGAQVKSEHINTTLFLPMYDGDANNIYVPYYRYNGDNNEICKYTLYFTRI